VSVARHREEKARDPARGGEKARPGGGFGVSPPFLPLGQARTEGVGARWGSRRLRHPLLRPLGRGGRSRARRGSQSTEELSPRGRGGSRRLRPDRLADPGQEGQAEGRLSGSPQHQWAVKETPRLPGARVLPRLAGVGRFLPPSNAKTGSPGARRGPSPLLEGADPRGALGTPAAGAPLPRSRGHKGRAQGQGGAREGVSARAKAIWKGILQPGATQTRDGAGPLASLRAARRGP
jgi:hypothetical protein